MYYLLENNKIIDSLNIREDLDLPVEIDFYVGKDEIVLTIDHIYFEHISIIKKAENVWDLIEKGDLIKIRFSDSFNILEACHIGGGVNGMTNITAIYKPDSSGNYIKVWEEKDE